MNINEDGIYNLKNNNTHWDRMVFMNSIMTSNILPNA